jgi:transcriptional regulator with XRE-family HTH domain
MSLGSRIKGLRSKAKLTQKDIADKLNMGSSNFGHIENDRVTPTSIDLEKIADIFNTTTDYLLGRSVVAVIEDRLSELNMTKKDLEKATQLPAGFIESLDTFPPTPWDYEPGELIDQISKILEMDFKTLASAYSRQEPPTYDGPRSTAEEDFANEEFDDVLVVKENSTIGAAEDGVDYKKFIEAIKDIADKHAYDLRDPEFIEHLNKALTFVKSIRGDKKG